MERQTWRWLLGAGMVLALLLAGVLWLPQTVAAQAEPAVTILADRLNVRSGPGTNYRVVTGVNGGERYHVSGQSGSCAWLKIDDGGKPLGWVSGSKAYVQRSGACSAIPAAGAAPAPAAPAGGQGCALLTNQLQLAVKLSVKRSDGRQSAWSIPVGGQTRICVDPGSYTATFTATGMPGSMAFLLTVQGGEDYLIPLRLPGQ